ncbi:MAG TPA: uroporphyrinogen decarboxylase family protein [Armatimonadota bacterium]|nr:uroporphyrinogen decarboxylase family protein [Armatimonadota bacterium]
MLTAFEHEEPDRVPAWCGASVEFWEKAKAELGLDDEGLRIRFGDDFRRVRAPFAGPEEPLSPGATYRTVFGIEREGLGYGQPMSHPLAEATLQQIHEYPWPDPAWTDVSHVRAEALAYGRQYAILGGDWSPFFHDAIDLLGMERLYYAMYDEPELVDALMRHMVDYYAGVSTRIFDAAADAIDIFFIGNDLGGQTGPLLGVDLFRRFILPHLARLVDLGHAYGLKVMLHCCGGIAPLIPDLVAAGLDGLHAVQPSCAGMDLRALKAQFGDRILFNGAIDSHHVLINGSPESVREQTRQVLKIMMPGGGYVAGASHDTILEETPVENVVAMFDTVKEYGTYGR